MKTLNNFLESSTIHGLAHISTTRKFVRIFWIWVVLSGFIAAAILIYHSVQNWAQSPVKTTISTMPITDLLFPKVTVCPPKDTFTNLNFDLLLTKNLTVHNDTRSMFADYAFELLHDSFYSEIMKNVSIISDEERYYNWYHGFTRLDLPFWQDTQLEYPVYTAASSGTISTKYFERKFDASKIDLNLRFSLIITTPPLAQSNENVTLYYEMEKISLQDLSSGLELYYFDGYGYLKQEDKYITVNITAPKKSYYVNLDRKKVQEEDLKTMKVNLMPGFRIKWSYENKEMKGKDEYSEWGNTIEFVKLSNLLHGKQYEVEFIWKTIKKIRMEYLNVFSANKDCDFANSFLSDLNIKENIKKLHHEFKVEPSEIKSLDIDPSTLNSAAEMFMYLNFCPKLLVISPWRKFYRDLFVKHSPDMFILTLNRIMITSRNKESMRNVPENLLRKIRETLQLQHQKIQVLTKMNLDKESESTLSDVNKCMMEDKEEKHCYVSSIGSELLKKVSRHPVHIKDVKGRMSPSSLIPFCGIGRNMSAMGVKMNKFDIPVCNSFTEKVLNDQLCYEVDPNNFIQRQNIVEGFKTGITLVLDYNEDREVSYGTQNGDGIQDEEEDIMDILVQTVSKQEALIYLNTIEPLKIFGEGNYNLNNVKDVKVTSSYLELSQEVTGCQHDEPFENCTTAQYIDSLKDICNCLPLKIIAGDEVPLCRPDQLQCVQNVTKANDCYQTCEGVLVTSFIRTETSAALHKKFMSKLYSDYEIYKGVLQFPPTLKEYEWKNKLRIVRIYFDTPTFDRITQDTVAKPEDKMSSIGGTMGLLTGFSIISAVEIVYFTLKIVYNFVRNNPKG